MARHTFLRGRRGRKAQVQVTVLGRKLAQGPDGYNVFQSGDSLSGSAWGLFSAGFPAVWRRSKEKMPMAIILRVQSAINSIADGAPNS
jgi:hypothetical protein